MMQRKQIAVAELKESVFSVWSERSLLLTSGDFKEGKYNCMTVGWGSLGVVWRMPFVQIFVRPTRYTRTFLDQYHSFTLCTFPDQYAEKLEYLGTVSGKDVDKITEAGLTPIASQVVAAPSFEEADLCLECEKMYWQDLDPQHFLLPQIEEQYALKDYHRIYYGMVKGTFQAE